MKPPGLADAGFEALRNLIRTRTGLVFPQTRQRDLEAGIRRTMSTCGILDIDRFAGLLETDEGIFDTLIANITVAETYFFREPAQFMAIRRQVLPDLRRRLPFDAQIRIWSAGCASGEEPYSLAILMEEEGLANRTAILATDISRSALARAREAAYGSWSLREGADDRAIQYFERHGDRFALRDRFRRRVDFRYLNLASMAYPSAITATEDMDLIICRNVLIYFDQETVAHVARQLFESLRTGGWLITGPSDPPLWDHAPYRTLVTGAGVLYRRDEQAEPRAPAPITSAGPPAIDRAPSVAAPWIAEPLGGPPPVMPLAGRTIAGAARIPEAETDRAADAYVLQVRALADRGDSRRAEADAAEALQLYPLSPELHHLHAVILVELGRHDEAIASWRRVIYLDPSLAIAHFMLGSVLCGRGATAEAQRAFQNALTLCLARPAAEILPLSDGEPTMNLIEAARAQLARINAIPEVNRNARR